jgi:ABC-type antimicrobial peptide transport system permease subunit
MFLCFFALSANMSTNIYEQKKEIGVLRALGLTRIRVILLFFYEAIVLVLSSCLLGMITGVIVAQTMTL